MIPVLSIHQPYASLITSGVKRWETRSWPCPAKYVGQRIAIASTVQRETYGCPSCLALCRWVDDAWVCRRCGDEFYDDPSWPGDRPTGRILGTVVVSRSLPVVDENGAFGRGNLAEDAYVTDSSRWEVFTGTGWGSLRTITTRMDGTTKVSEVVDIFDQLPYGYWEPGGWAWELTDPQPTTERCPWCLTHPASDSGQPLAPASDCPVCDGTGHCDPIPVKGRQGIWRWDGTRRPT